MTTTTPHGNGLTSFSQISSFYHSEHLPTTHKLDVFLALKERKRRGGGDILGFPFDFTPPVAEQAIYMQAFTVALTPWLVSFVRGS